MPCFGCLNPEDNMSTDDYRPHERSHPRGSDFAMNHSKNFDNLKVQIQVLRLLSESTYGLAIDGVKSHEYKAQDFFSFKEVVGCGATSVVFRAVFKPTGEVFAVKFIPNFKACKNLVVRELCVFKISDKCRELVAYHSHFRVGPNLYFVMELCEGGTLMTLLESKAVMPPRFGRIYMKEISNALFYLHRNKIVHRDLSICNCFVTKTAHVRLGDFGHCRGIDDPVNGEIMTLCGKASVRAPEMYLNKPCGFALDWWAAGIMIYRFSTGYFPFKTDKLTEGFQCVTKMKEKYPDWAFADHATMDICQKFLEKDPKKRLGFDNETSIKEHPYFHDVDWDGEEDMENVLQLTMQSDCSKFHPVLKKVATILNVPMDTDSDRKNSRASGYQKALTKVVNQLLALPTARRETFIIQSQETTVMIVTTAIFLWRRMCGRLFLFFFLFL